MLFALACAEESNCAVCILLGLCPDWAEWDPNQPVQNAREAMQQADDWLGVPQVRCTVSLCFCSACCKTHGLDLTRCVSLFF